MIQRDENGVLHVVALSGGKDSTCLAILLKEREPRPYTYVCTPTGRELPEMFLHWRNLGVMLGSPILPVMATDIGGLHGLIRKEKMIPNARARFCTRKLKIEPYRIWLKEQAAQGPLVSHVGLRADELGRAGGAYDDIEGVEMRFALREWGMDEAAVWAALDQRNINIPERTDCAECYDQQLGEWWRLWHDHLDLWMEAEAIEEERSPHTFRSATRDTWPAPLKDLRAEFEKGRVPTRGYDPRERTLFRSGACRACSL